VWARHCGQAQIPPGARILQVGAGVGYDTAILSHLAGPDGRVTAYEVEPGLAARAGAHFEGAPNVTVHHGNAATDLASGARFDWVVAFAGMTHVPALWAEALTPDAQLLVPLTAATWWGAMVHAKRSGVGFDAVTLGRAGVYPCSGARDAEQEARISDLLSDPKRLIGTPFRLTGFGPEARLELAASDP